MNLKTKAKSKKQSKPKLKEKARPISGSYKVKFVDFPKEYRKLRKEMLSEIDRVLKAGDLILRDDVSRFEKNLSRFTYTKYAVGVGNGTDAIFLSLKALGIGKGDEVITSGYTFWATVEAIINCGATPILADIGDNLLIDPKSVESRVTGKTRAIIPVHIGGAVCDMQSIMALACKYDLKIIEDTAQALGAYKPVGDMQTYSFYPAKVLGCYGDGGAITTNTKEYADNVRLLRDHGRKTKHKTVCVGFNSRLDNLQAAVLSIKLQYLKEIIKRRQAIAKIYDEELGKIKEIILPKSITYQEYNLLVPYQREKLVKFLEDNGVETIIGDYTFPMKVTDKCRIMNKTVLRLPIWPTLINKEIYYVCSVIKKFYE